MSVPGVNGSGAQAPSASSVLLVAVAVAIAVAPFGAVHALEPDAPDHLVISEVVTGAASASDEIVEIYNPTSAPLPLEGLELVYVSASGATVSRRAAWGLGAPPLEPGAHLLVANEAGIYAAIADAVYASGMAATGGSVALRIVGASTGIDGVGWGTAVGSWLEGTAAPVATVGSSIERLPGGGLGSTQDTGDNASDFVERLVPDPQNTSSPPVPTPGATPEPTSLPTTAPTTAPTAEPTPEPTPEPGTTAIAVARAMPDGSRVTVEGVALTGFDFHDGGGYVADATGGIAILTSDGAFSPGSRLRVTGTVEDRFAQRTIRASGSDIADLGPAADPSPQTVTTGAVGEGVEGTLVQLAGTVDGSPTTLTSGIAFDVDDGSGAARVVVGTATGIDTTSWESGVLVDLVGVVGQRDSSGTGASGYRVQPRGVADVRSVSVPPPTPAPTGQVTPSPGATVPPAGVISIADARAAEKNARVAVRGVVTLGSGVVDDATAVIQDGTGAIVLRLGDEAGSVALGETLEVGGVRSTKSGMETLRVTTPPVELGTSAIPAPRLIRTGEAGEALEAILVGVRGAIVAAPRRVASGTLSFELDDGSGPLRIVVDGSLGLDAGGLVAGTWLDVRGVLGQETSGAQPLRGYRVWPASAGDVRVGAAAVDAEDRASATGARADGGEDGPRSLSSIGAQDLAGLTIGATLVAGPWAELELGGLLWDGRRLVGLDAASAPTILHAAASLPTRLELRGLRSAGVREPLGLELVALGREAGDLAVGGGMPHAPSATLPTGSGGPAWLSVVGTLRVTGPAMTLVTGGAAIRIERRCAARRDAPEGVVRAVGIGLADPPRLVVGCDGIVSAPRLERASVGAGRLARDGTSALTSPAAVTATGTSQRLVAAALLVAGALVLVAVALANRWFGMDPDAVATPSDVATRDVEEDVPPRLALVRLPGERGSP